MRFFPILGVFLFTGCLTPIDFPVERGSASIVLSGMLDNQVRQPGEENKLLITTTTIPGQRPQTIDNATVTLFEDGVELANYQFDGFVGYLLPVGIVPIPGRTYHVKVVLENGTSFRSEPETMPLAVPNVSATGRFVVDNKVDAEGAIVSGTFYRVSAELTEIPRNCYVRLRTDETWVIEPTNFPDPFNSIPAPCYVTAEVDPQNLNILNLIGARSNVSINLFDREVDPSFLVRHFFSVSVLSITPAAYDYFQKVDIIANQNGSIFDVPPAEITGNWKNETQPDARPRGFFFVANVATTRISVARADVPVFLGTYCEYLPGREEFLYPRECINCLSIPGSKNERPYWWPN
jgi:hypothetical protein